MWSPFLHCFSCSALSSEQRDAQKSHTLGLVHKCSPKNVTSSLHQGEMRLQERVHAANQARRGQRLTNHRAQSCGLSVGSSGGQSPPAAHGRQTKVSRTLCLLCVHLFLRVECQTLQVKIHCIRISWWSSGQDSALPMLGAKVQSPVRELISYHAEWHGQEIKQAKNKPRKIF